MAASRDSEAANFLELLINERYLWFSTTSGLSDKLLLFSVSS
jgi:hypothetical protein